MLASCVRFSLALAASLLLGEGTNARVACRDSPCGDSTCGQMRDSALLKHMVSMAGARETPTVAAPRADTGAWFESLRESDTLVRIALSVPRLLSNCCGIGVSR